MASNIDVTLKRYNGTDYDIILPVTHLGQLYTDDTLATSLSSYLDTTFINLNQKGAANGVATLDANQKITASQLPAYIFGGMTYAGVVDLTSGKTIDDIMEAADPGNTVNKLSAVGEYLQVSATGVLSQGTTWTGTILAPGDEGDYDISDGITLEAGDWVVVSAYDGTANTVSLGIVNNTYQSAATNKQGIVTLSSLTTLTAASGNKVITDGILAGLIGTETGDIAAGDHLHDERYYTETEIGNYFGGITSITGYNKTNWDAAYADKINSIEFDGTNGVLTFTQQDETTLTVDLDGRYVEGITAAQTDSTDGIVIANTGQDFTVAHADTSSQASVDNSDGNVIQDITLDTFGHITALGSTNLDDRYYTETEFNTWLNGQTAIDSHYFTEILYGASPTAVNIGTIVIDTA